MPDLFHAPPSPFVRKVRVVAAETGTDLRLIAVTPSPVARDADLAEANPLGKIPCLRLEDGTLLYDSRVICCWLGAGSALYPAGEGEWRAARREALADGLMEAALLARYEIVLRPEALRWPDWIDGQMQKVRAALDQMERDEPDPARPDIGDIATACALFYLDFRFPSEGWRASHPRLAGFADAVARRPSFETTRPA